MMDEAVGIPSEGHRQRLREGFLAREVGALADDALLELLVCYAVPQRDVQPIAKRLIKKYGNLSALLLLDAAALCSEDATLADWIRHAKLSGMYDAGKSLFERGGLTLDRLPRK